MFSSFWVKVALAHDKVGWTMVGLDYGWLELVWFAVNQNPKSRPKPSILDSLSQNLKPMLILKKVLCVKYKCTQTLCNWGDLTITYRLQQFKNVKILFIFLECLSTDQCNIDFKDT